MGRDWQERIHILQLFIVFVFDALSVTLVLSLYLTLCLRIKVVRIWIPFERRKPPACTGGKRTCQSVRFLKVNFEL